MIDELIKELEENKNTGNLSFSKTILQIVPGGYGEGDELLAIKTPILNKIGKKYAKNLSYDDYQYLLNSNIHEYRYIAVFMLSLKYKNDQKTVFEFYLNNIKSLNNWDIIDISCHKIVGIYLNDCLCDEEIFLFLKKLYNSDNFWQRRIAIVSCSYLIKKGKLELCFDFFKEVTKEKHPINHKALGWMLRELGKQDKKLLTKFLEENAISNVSYSYATEKYAKEEKALLKRAIFLLIILLIPFQVMASSGSIGKDNVMKKNGVLYGYHGKDNHCHTVTETKGKYYAKDLVDNSYCEDIIKKNNARFVVEFSSCVDGDTMKVKIEGEEKTVRFLAIDTEESVSKKELNTYMGKKASNFTCKKIKNAEKLEIEYDPSSNKLDKYNRVLGWVYVDDKLLQETLVEKGYAKVAYLYGDYKYTETLKEKQKKAKEEKKGIWNKNDIVAIIYNFIQKIIKLFT